LSTYNLRGGIRQIEHFVLNELGTGGYVLRIEVLGRTPEVIEGVGGVTDV
jgi:hypothetical protein